MIAQKSLRCGFWRSEFAREEKKELWKRSRQEMLPPSVHVLLQLHAIETRETINSSQATTIMCYIFVLLVVFLAPSCLILDLLFPNDSFHFLSWHEAIYRDFLVRPSACMHVSMSDSYFL